MSIQECDYDNDLHGQVLWNFELYDLMVIYEPKVNKTIKTRERSCKYAVLNRGTSPCATTHV